MRNVGVLLASVLTLFAAEAVRAADSRDALVVSPAWLAQHLNDPDLVVLYVGAKPDYDAGHLPGARYLNYQDLAVTDRTPGDLTLQMLPADGLKQRLEAVGISNASRIVLYDSGENAYASPSARVMFTLDYAGLGGRTSGLDGGLEAWRRAGHPVTTDLTPFDKGAYASSGTFFSGNAALKAAEDLRDKILKAASVVLAEPAADLVIDAPGMVKGKRGAVSFATLAHMSIQGEHHGELVGFGSFKTDHAAFPYGAHFVEVAVNCRTGDVKVTKYYAYQDCGTPINPDLALGQMYGGVMKAIGHALYEEMIYDDTGRLLNPRFTDYKVPTVFELPEDFRAELVPVEDEEGPFGAKSVAEITLNGAAPAIAIAIHDAVGAWVREWPFTPERVVRAMGRLP